MANEKIQAVAISNICGLEELTIDVGPDGLLLCGDNGVGKTSALTAIKLALGSKGIGDEALRVGADKGTVDIRLESKAVRKVLGKGKGVSVTTDDGAKYPAPVTLLRKLLGTDSLDPLTLLHSDKAAVKAAVFSACPVTVDHEFLREYVPRLPDSFDVNGHGLDVIERLRKIAYDKRTAANAKAKETAEDARRAKDRAESLAENAPDSPADVDAAAKTLNTARAALGRLEAQRDRHEDHAAKTAEQRTRVEEIRVQAQRFRAKGTTLVSGQELAEQERKASAAQAEVSRLSAALEAAQIAAGGEWQTLNDMREQNRIAKENEAAAKDLEARADELEGAISASAVERVPSEAIEQARATVEQAEIALTSATADTNAWEAFEEAMQAGDEAHRAAETAEAEANRLDVMVKRLTNEAPAALVAQSGGIPGLAVQGDDIYLDGVNFSMLNGAKRVRLAVQIAKRTIAQHDAAARVLICDGLEVLSDRNMEAFVSEATEGGWQLFGTRVTNDERLVLIPLGLEADRAPVAAE